MGIAQAGELLADDADAAVQPLNRVCIEAAAQRQDSTEPAHRFAHFVYGAVRVPAAQLEVLVNPVELRQQDGLQGGAQVRRCGGIAGRRRWRRVSHGRNLSGCPG